ncbi:MAG: hypothetical protein KAS12_06505 [Candidatus Aenigmarchaeota archaeon]|nr:hypothetical protein [Candidatus Aenigmarchaeota archaeon]
MIEKIYGKNIESIYYDEDKIPVKNFESHFSVKALENAMNGKNELQNLMQYSADEHLQNVILFANVEKIKGKPFVQIFYKAPNKLSIRDQNKIKKYLKGQIYDGWNENGQRVVFRRRKYSIFLKP